MSVRTFIREFLIYALYLAPFAAACTLPSYTSITFAQILIGLTVAGVLLTFAVYQRFKPSVQCNILQIRPPHL